MSNLPERINVMKVITYNVEEVRASLAELNGIELSEVKDNEIVDLISSWVSDDFSCGHGHTTDTDDLIWQDQDGEELDY